MTHRAYKIVALLLAIVFVALTLVSCGNKDKQPEQTGPNSQVTSPSEGYMNDTAADALKDFFDIPDSNTTTQIPPDDGVYTNGFVLLGTYTSFVFMGDKYVYNETKMGKIDEDATHQGTWEIKDGKLILTPMSIDPTTLLPVIGDIKSYTYAQYADGRLSINGKTFTMMKTESEDSETDTETDNNEVVPDTDNTNTEN